MSRGLWALGGALALLAVPLALSPTTTWMVVPAHGVLTLVACAGAVVDAWAGRIGRARLWGAAYLVATAAMLGSLEVGAILRGCDGWAWTLPFVAALVWGWLPPLVSGLAAWWASARS
ncbi:MAG: hypothetical protein ACI8PZ_004368 [Myxococcota bacterium]